jgi:hypothetical protein
MGFWFSGPRILWGLIRPGINVRPDDFAPPARKPRKLATWQRYELREELKARAVECGEKMTNARADYLIDKAIATGEIDLGSDEPEPPPITPVRGVLALFGLAFLRGLTGGEKRQRSEPRSRLGVAPKLPKLATRSKDPWLRKYRK